MADSRTNTGWYSAETKNEFIELLRKIRDHGEWIVWRGRDDDFRYWQIRAIINRRRANDPEVYFAGEIRRAAEEAKARKRGPRSNRKS